MALVEFQNNSAPYINADNLNNNFNETNKINDATLLLNSSIINEITPIVGSNYQFYGNSFYYKVGKTVHIHLGLSGLTPNESNEVFIMPEGYRPVALSSFTGIGSDLDEIIGCYIPENGKIAIYPKTQYALIDISYDAFN